MGEFIKIEIDQTTCSGIETCDECVKVCPVNIFEKRDNDLVIVEENEDECTLCDLCKRACGSHAVTIHKLYEEGYGLD